MCSTHFVHAHRTLYNPFSIRQSCNLAVVSIVEDDDDNNDGNEEEYDEDNDNNRDPVCVMLGYVLC